MTRRFRVLVILVSAISAITAHASVPVGRVRGSWTRSCWSRPAPNPSGSRFGARLRCGTRRPASDTERRSGDTSTTAVRESNSASAGTSGQTSNLLPGQGQVIGFGSRSLLAGRVRPDGERSVGSRTVPDPVRRGADGVVASRRDLRSAESPGAGPVAAMPASTGVLRHSKADAVLIALSLAHAILLVAFPSRPLIALGLWWNANTISHNFVHLPFFRSPVLNRAYSIYLTLLLAIPHSLWRERHLRHHSGRDARDSMDLGDTPRGGRWLSRCGSRSR